MRQFTTIKIGYSVGVYGCSGEYFTTIYTDGSKNGSFSFEGMYGAEERVNSLMREKGYKQFYTNSFYGRMTRNDRTKYIQSEYTAIEYIKRGFKRSQKELDKEQRELDKIVQNMNK